jgi:hypothetical protein
MSTAGLNLLIPDKPDRERDALADAFMQQGGKVHRIGRFWEPPHFAPTTVRVYGPDAFCLVLQQRLKLKLCSPDDNLLLRVPGKLLQRQIACQSLREVSALCFPVFIKPLTPKQFRAAVYQSALRLELECHGLSLDTSIIVAEPVTLIAEARCFLLEGIVLDTAIYQGSGDANAARRFASTLRDEIALPRAVVVDVGFIADRGWAIIEFNAAWGAGLNGCDPTRVLSSIVAASGAD